MSNGENGNGKFVAVLLGITVTLAATGIVGTVVMYGKITSMQTTVTDLDRRLGKVEGDIYTPRFSRSPAPVAVSPQANANP